MNKEQIVEALERSEMAEQVTLPIEKWREVLIQLQQAENKNTCYEQQLKTNTHQVCEKIRKDIYDSKVPIEYSKTLSISDNNFINGYQYGTMSCLRILEQIEGGNL